MRVLLSRVANRLISRVTGVHLHDYGCSLKVYRREVLEQIRLYGELHRFIPMLLAEVGAVIREIPVNHRPRIHGRSKYALDRSARVLLDLLLVVFLRRYSVRARRVVFPWVTRTSETTDVVRKGLTRTRRPKEPQRCCAQFWAASPGKGRQSQRGNSPHQRPWPNNYKLHRHHNPETSVSNCARLFTRGRGSREYLSD